MLLLHGDVLNRINRLERARRVSQLRWTHGSVLPEEVRARLSEEECQFFEQYDELLARTMARVDLDLTAVRGAQANCSRIDTAIYALTLTHARSLVLALALSLVHEQNLEAPPRDLFVEVRALEDFGAVVTGSGTVTLLKNVTYLVRRSDVDHLIRTGILEVIG